MSILRNALNSRHVSRRLFAFMSATRNELRDLRVQLAVIQTQIGLDQAGKTTLVRPLPPGAAAMTGGVGDVQAVTAQTTMLPSGVARSDVAEEVRSVLRLLRPYGIMDHTKRRFGRPHDGGYVMIDDIRIATKAISLGINDDVSWDFDLAERGLDITQYDHSIARLPMEHPRFHFTARKVGPNDTDETVSLDQVLLNTIVGENRDIILKIDIEGDEWPTLDNTDPALLARCTQILVEYHHLGRLVEADFQAVARRVVTKLSKDFFVCHVHGNNWGDFVNCANVVIPETLEVTYANRTLYMMTEGLEIFPQAIDMPNQEGRADLFLGAFRF